MWLSLRLLGLLSSQRELLFSEKSQSAARDQAIFMLAVLQLSEGSEEVPRYRKGREQHRSFPPKKSWVSQVLLYKTSGFC